MIIHLRLRLSNAYLIKGDRPILVDTGSPGETEALLRALARHGVNPRDLALIIHTHGHSDHCGSTWDLQQASQAPVAIHAADADRFRSGSNGALKPIGVTARMLLPLVSQPFRGMEPDILIEDEMSLESYGLNARIVFTPGHTAGSISILTAGGEVIAGDLLMGGVAGGAAFAGRPDYHYFADDLSAVRASIQKLLRLEPTRVYVGHGGPLAPERIMRRFANEIDLV